MAGSTFGDIFKITTWGESHGEAIGVVIDGCPAGLLLSPDDIQAYLNRRKPGKSEFATPRKEDDEIKILSGVFEGRTTGTPISLMVKNTNQLSRDYEEISAIYRPGHADITYDAKYGFRDYRGGGRSSGRETIGRVAAGAIAAKILAAIGIKILAFTRGVGPVEISGDISSMTDVGFDQQTMMPDKEAAEKAAEFLRSCKEKSDSAGSVIECRINGVPAGIGEPVFEKLDARLAGAMMSIGAVKAVEIGDGFASSKALGSENNDEYDVKIGKKSNHSGGILGGISDGSEIVLRIHLKPTPSIGVPQQTIDQHGQPATIKIKGRHDPVIAPRAAVVTECMAAIVILDAMMMNMRSKLDNFVDFYKR
ncbi:MAG: chorismate synthase [Lachnospiraceae bacterium]|nr:chorismate synthase [Lachnospiraceae bacterium]